MQMRPQIQIKSVIKALSDVVLPAVDPANKLAQEQGRLAIGLLHLLAQQLPVQERFDRDELHRLLDSSGRLQAAARGGSGTQNALAELAVVTESAQRSLDASTTSAGLILHSVRELRRAIGTLVTQVYRDGEVACRDLVRDLVLSLSKDQLLRERAMMLMQGWEPDPAAIPSLDSLLDASAR